MNETEGAGADMAPVAGPRPPGPGLPYLSSEMGGLGAGGMGVGWAALENETGVEYRWKGCAFRTPESATLPSIFITFLCFITFCDPLIFIAFQGAAAAAAGRGSPPPPGAGVVGVSSEICK